MKLIGILAAAKVCHEPQEHISRRSNAAEPTSGADFEMAACATPQIFSQIICALIAHAASILSFPAVSSAFVSAHEFSCNTSNVSTLTICNFLCSFQQALLVPLSTLTVFPGSGAFIAKLCTAAATKWSSSWSAPSMNCKSTGQLTSCGCTRWIFPRSAYSLDTEASGFLLQHRRVDRQLWCLLDTVALYDRDLCILCKSDDGKLGREHVGP